MQPTSFRSFTQDFNFDSLELTRRLTASSRAKISNAIASINMSDSDIKLWIGALTRKKNDFSYIQKIKNEPFFQILTFMAACLPKDDPYHLTAEEFGTLAVFFYAMHENPLGYALIDLATNPKAKKILTSSMPYLCYNNTHGKIASFLTENHITSLIEELKSRPVLERLIFRAKKPLTQENEDIRSKIIDMRAAFLMLSKTEEHITYKILPSFGVTAIALQVLFGNQAVLPNPVVGISLASDIANAQKNGYRDVMIPFFAAMPPTVADYLHIQEATDFFTHDASFHLFAASLVPKNYRSFFLALADRIDPEKSLFLKGFQEKLIDLDCPVFRNLYEDGQNPAFLSFFLWSSLAMHIQALSKKGELLDLHAKEIIDLMDEEWLLQLKNPKKGLESLPNHFKIIEKLVSAQMLALEGAFQMRFSKIPKKD